MAREERVGGKQLKAELNINTDELRQQIAQDVIRALKQQAKSRQSEHINFE